MDLNKGAGIGQGSTHQFLDGTHFLGLLFGKDLNDSRLPKARGDELAGRVLECLQVHRLKSVGMIAAIRENPIMVVMLMGVRFVRTIPSRTSMKYKVRKQPENFNMFPVRWKGTYSYDRVLFSLARTIATTNLGTHSGSINHLTSHSGFGH